MRDDELRNLLAGYVTPGDDYPDPAEVRRAGRRRVARTWAMAGGAVAAAGLIALAAISWPHATITAYPAATPSAGETATPTPEPSVPATPVSPSSSVATPTPSASNPAATPSAPTPTRELSGTTIGFGSPTGNLVCVMSSSSGVVCMAVSATWSGSGVPPEKQRGCDVFGPFGPQHDVVLDADGAFGWCVTELKVQNAYLTEGGQTNPFGPKYRTWFDPQRDTTAANTLGSVPVLPYGGTATTGRYRCTMNTSGVTCKDATTGHGFLLSKTRVSVD